MKSTEQFTLTLIIFAVSLSACSVAKSDPYLERLRTQYTGSPSEEDKTKFTPLQYNTDRILFEKALDIFLNSNLTVEEREQIAPIIVNRIRFVQILARWGDTPLETRQRVTDKIEKAIYMGVYDMAKESPRDDFMDMMRKYYIDDPIAIEDR
jgi:hypothetical protein